MKTTLWHSAISQTAKSILGLFLRELHTAILWLNWHGGL